MYFNGSIYEGGWEADKKSNRGRMYDKISGDVYSGEYHEGKRNGRGRLLNWQQQTIYEGEWANDRRHGEGIIIDRAGNLCSGEFRTDYMEGKLTQERTLP